MIPPKVVVQLTHTQGYIVLYREDSLNNLTRTYLIEHGNICIKLDACKLTKVITQKQTVLDWITYRISKLHMSFLCFVWHREFFFLPIHEVIAPEICEHICFSNIPPQDVLYVAYILRRIQYTLDNFTVYFEFTGVVDNNCIGLLEVINYWKGQPPFQVYQNINSILITNRND